MPTVYFHDLRRASWLAAFCKKHVGHPLHSLASTSDSLNNPTSVLSNNRSKEVRKSIARVLTVLTSQKRDALREFYSTKKYKPLDLRPKKTRAIRRRLTSEQINKKTLRQQKKEKAFPMRKYAIKA